MKQRLNGGGSVLHDFAELQNDVDFVRCLVVETPLRCNILRRVTLGDAEGARSDAQHLFTNAAYSIREAPDAQGMTFEALLELLGVA